MSKEEDLYAMTVCVCMCVNICTFAVVAMYISASLCNSVTSVYDLGFRVYFGVRTLCVTLYMPG